MKGVVYTECLEHAECRITAEEIQAVITRYALLSGRRGTDTDHENNPRISALVTELTSARREPQAETLRRYGWTLAKEFREAYPEFFDARSFFEFIELLDSRINTVILKKYPDAEMPRFRAFSLNPRILIVDYFSALKLEDLVCGFLEEIADYFDERVNIGMSIVPKSSPRIVRFRLEKVWR